LVDFFKSSPLKPLSQLNRNLVGSIYGRSSITKFRFIWPSSFKGEDLKKIDQSETRIACGGHGCYDWLIFKILLPLKLLGQMNRNLVGCIYGRSSIKILAQQFQSRRFLEIDQSETRIACSGHVC
jgi:hypothetical protein